MTPTRIALIAVAAIAVILLAVLAVQASAARSLLRRVRDDQMYHGPAPLGDGSEGGEHVGRARSYSIVVDLYSAHMLAADGAPPTLSEGTPFVCGGSLTTLTASYVDECWLVLRRSAGGAAQLGEDAAAHRLRSAAIAGCIVRIFAWTPPPQKLTQNIAQSKKQKAQDNVEAMARQLLATDFVVLVLARVDNMVLTQPRPGCAAVPVVQPLTGLSGDFASLSAQLTGTGSHSELPMHVLAF